MSEEQPQTQELNRPRKSQRVGTSANPALNAATTVERFKSRHDSLCQNYTSGSPESQMQHFIQTVTMDPPEIRRHYQVLDDLRNLLVPSFPDVQLHPFGSLISELGEKDADVDVFVDCYGDAMIRGRTLDKDQKTKLFQAVLRLLRKNHGFREVLPIPQARVPIIKFIHAETNVHSDISFENMLSIRNSELIHFLVKLDPRVRPLTCLIRYWGKFHQLTSSLKIKNYAVNLLVLVFLTRKKILPSIYSLQHWGNGSVPLVRIDHWNASFFDDHHAVLDHLNAHGRPLATLNSFGVPTTSSILQLAQEFFTFYQSFPADTHVLCTLTAEFIPRDVFIPGNELQLPKELQDYQVFCAEADNNPDLRRLTVDPRQTWIIQDPFALNFNVGAVTKDNILQRFLRACDITATKLLEVLDSLGNQSATREEGSFNLMEIFPLVNFDDLPANQKAWKVLKGKEFREAMAKYNAEGGDDGPRGDGDNASAYAQHISDYLKALEQRQKGTRITGGATDVLNFEKMSSKSMLTPLHQSAIKLLPPVTFKQEFFDSFTSNQDQHSVPVPMPQIIRKGKILWVSFVKDFFKLIFSKGFGLEVVIEERDHLEEEANADVESQSPEIKIPSEKTCTVENTSLNLKPDQSPPKYPNPFLMENPLSALQLSELNKVETPDAKVTSGTKRPSPAPVGLSPSSSPRATKYQKSNETSPESKPSTTMDKVPVPAVSEEVYERFSMRIQCSGEKTFWEGRTSTLKQIRREIPDFKNLTNPISIESEITNKYQVSAATGPIKFDCTVTFEPAVKDVSVQVTLQEVLFPMRKPGRSLQAMTFLATAIPEIHEKYVMFRLRDWLPVEIVSPVPSPPKSIVPKLPAVKIQARRRPSPSHATPDPEVQNGMSFYPPGTIQLPGPSAHMF